MFDDKDGYIEVLIRVPKDLFVGKNDLDIMQLFSDRAPERFTRLLVDAMVKEVLPNIERPQINPEELKERMLDKIVEKKLED